MKSAMKYGSVLSKIIEAMLPVIDKVEKAYQDFGILPKAVEGAKDDAQPKQSFWDLPPEEQRARIEQGLPKLERLVQALKSVGACTLSRGEPPQEGEKSGSGGGS